MLTDLFNNLQELGYEPTLSGLSSLNGDMVANSCRRTLTTLIQNAMENVENKILEVLETIGEQMAPVIKDFLLKSTNLVTYAARDKTAVLNYLDENLVLLKKNLTEVELETKVAEDYAKFYNQGEVDMHFQPGEGWGVLRDFKSS